ncbi:hypothetical protein BGY98DRAFT_938410 [Russula aff. rugulosa BPL654]|nr:hypothetical protein BGY98DRAFT_938410 [Russula aff. rugulosa BPL654]
MTIILTCRQTDSKCYKIDNSSLCSAGLLYDQQQGAAEFLDCYLDTLVEVPVAPSTSVGTHMPDLASGPKAEELEEKTQPGGVQTEWDGETTQSMNITRESRQTAEVAWYHRRRRLTSNPTQHPRPLFPSSLPIQFAPDLYSAARFVPKDETSSGPAATLATKANGVAMRSESSPISPFVSSNGKGDLVTVFTHVACCGKASSVMANPYLLQSPSVGGGDDEKVWRERNQRMDDPNYAPGNRRKEVRGKAPKARRDQMRSDMLRLMNRHEYGCDDTKRPSSKAFFLLGDGVHVQPPGFEAIGKKD